MLECVIEQGLLVLREESKEALFSIDATYGGQRVGCISGVYSLEEQL